MSCKLWLALTVAMCVFASLEAASLRGVLAGTNAVIQKLDYEGVEANVRSARQSYAETDSDEDSDEDDDEDDAELQHQAVIRRQQAYEQSVDNSQEGSDEENFEEEEDDDDDDDYFGRRIKRAADQSESSNEIQNTPLSSVETENLHKEPALETSSVSSVSSTTSAPSAAGSSNTSVLILIRDVIKKVTELPNTQQVATSAQQYFQMFEHLLQQTIEQVIGDDDDEDENESTTIAAETDKESVTEIGEQNENEKQPLPLNQASDQESSNELESSQDEHEQQTVDVVNS